MDVTRINAINPVRQISRAEMIRHNIHDGPTNRQSPIRDRTIKSAVLLPYPERSFLRAVSRPNAVAASRWFGSVPLEDQQNTQTDEI